MNGCVYTAGGEFGCGRVPGPAPGAQLDRMPMPMPIDVVEGFDPSISSSSSSFPSPQAVQAADLDAAAKAQRDATNAMWLADGSMANARDSRSAMDLQISSAQAQWQQLNSQRQTAIDNKNSRFQSASSSAQSFVQSQSQQDSSFLSGLALQP